MSALLVVHLPIPTLLMVVMVSAAVVFINNTGSLLTVVTDMVLTLFRGDLQLLSHTVQRLCLLWQFLFLSRRLHIMKPWHSTFVLW